MLAGTKLSMWQRAGLTLLISTVYLIEGRVRQNTTIPSYGIDPDIFASILDRECESELKLLASTQGLNAVTDAWRKSTEHWSHVQSPQTFLVCNDYPMSSGFERRKQIQKAMFECVFIHSYNGGKILKDTIFNDDNMTCVYVHTVASIAQCIWNTGTGDTTIANHSKLENINNQNVVISKGSFRIQPLLPMMKFATGTVAKAESLLWNASDVSIAMEISSSHYYILSDSTDFAKALMLGRKVPFSRVQLLEALPYTGRLIEYIEHDGIWGRPEEGQDNIELNDNITDGTMDESHRIIFRTRNFLKNVSNTTNMTAILSFLAHLASYPCIRYIEILDDE